jgi:hypothetical protein
MFALGLVVGWIVGSVVTGAFIGFAGRARAAVNETKSWLAELPAETGSEQAAPSRNGTVRRIPEPPHGSPPPALPPPPLLRRGHGLGG